VKKCTFIGPAAALLHTLERLTRRYKTNFLVDGAVEEEAQNNFVVRKLGEVRVTRVQDRPLRLFEIVSAKAANDNEWMYQLHGDAVHTAMTLCDLAKELDAKVLLTEAVCKDCTHSLISCLVGYKRTQSDTLALPTRPPPTYHSTRPCSCALRRKRIQTWTMSGCTSCRRRRRSSVEAQAQGTLKQQQQGTVLETRICRLEDVVQQSNEMIKELHECMEKLLGACNLLSNVLEEKTTKV